MADHRTDVREDSEMAVTVATPDPKNVQELTQYVTVLLQQMQERFQTIHFIYLNCCVLDEMGTRIDDLERNIADLMTQAGPEEPDK
ncbi:putative heat shock factor-binding protein 1-like [Penaeus vannamei]|uniref:Putative heat shock factor-binding protein 1-like n=1 Tax=Penaeus vannamei TaxID=6689 RepID=A0A3R7PCG6_PENVA|nr:putative heat shock factor-binding protein 1-like [Penaeus vannamei]